MELLVILTSCSNNSGAGFGCHLVKTRRAASAILRSRFLSNKLMTSHDTTSRSKGAGSGGGGMVFIRF